MITQKRFKQNQQYLLLVNCVEQLNVIDDHKEP